VDAGGLYVGMTRGRRHNEVVLTAAAAEPARAELVEMMQRGRIEATLDDAREAARNELGRAARTPDTPADTAPARWNDRTRRPVGAVIDLETRTRAAQDRQRQLHKDLERVVHRLARDRRTLAEVHAQLTARQARNHQAYAANQTGIDTADLEAVELRLTKRIQDNTATRATLSREYRHVATRAEAGRIELALRDQLPETIAAAEDRARSAHTTASRRSTTTGPTVRPERPDHGPSLR
jgi:hypothetical protein